VESQERVKTYFQSALATELGIPYQSLINKYRRGDVLVFGSESHGLDDAILDRHAIL
jgi:tRNA(Leu) C34 or U34 (ribose-2'-O)-methylase TrmL